jgi:hypothetical protein
MTTYITQEQAVALAKEAGALIENWLTCPPKLGLLYLTPEQAHATCNAAIQHYKDSQPKPASVEEIMELADRYSHARDMQNVDVDEYRLELSQAITQQAEALAQALAENSNLNSELTAALENWGHMQEECKKLRTQMLVDTKYTLPEPVGYRIKVHGSVNTFVVRQDVADERAYKLIEQFGANAVTVDAVHTSDQVRQAIAKAKQVPQLPEHATPQMQIAGASVKIDMTGVDAEPGTIGWLTAARVWMTMYRAALAAAPDPKEAL